MYFTNTQSQETEPSTSRQKSEEGAHQKLDQKHYRFSPGNQYKRSSIIRFQTHMHAFKHYTTPQ